MSATATAAVTPALYDEWTGKITYAINSLAVETDSLQREMQMKVIMFY